MKFSLIIPLWNEGANVIELIQVIANSALLQNGMAELILVNNGSSDSTGELINEAACSYSWIVPVHLEQNQNYGGGVYEGFKHARSELFCYIPGDLQVMPEDVVRIFKALSAHVGPKFKLLVKGNRTVRYDPFQTRFVSCVYTLLANIFLGLHVKDINGLPKMFHRSLIDLVPAERMKSFVFDAQLISLANIHNWVIKEVPVTFYSRRTGLSSWSSKRFQVYKTVFLQLLRLRSLRHHPGVFLSSHNSHT